jgi:hypothetical protein
LFLQNKDLPEDSDHPKQIDPDHDVGSDVEMEDDAHDDTDTMTMMPLLMQMMMMMIMMIMITMVMMMLRQLLVASSDIHDHIDCIMDHF